LITIDINPVAFAIGPLSVRWYGLMYVVGIVVGLLVAWPYAKSKGLTEDQLEKVVLVSIPSGLVGARLYFVLQQPLGPYLAQPWRILAFWEGGMAFYGAIFAVVIAIIIMTWRMHIPIWKFLDMAGLFAVVGQFFGRIGNIINGDVVGYPTTLPWGVIYANPNSLAPSHTIAYQPAAAYEAISNIILFVILWLLRNKFKPGILFFIYVIGYSLFQVALFFGRDNVVIAFGLKQAQLTAIGVIIVGAIILFLLLRHYRRVKAPEETEVQKPS
jgi:phosphatidylglycerol---prolipoprotein diacylglyceryl transferase